MGLYFNNQALTDKFSPLLENELAEQTDAAGGHCESMRPHITWPCSKHWWT